MPTITMFKEWMHKIIQTIRKGKQIKNLFEWIKVGTSLGWVEEEAGQLNRSTHTWLRNIKNQEWSEGFLGFKTSTEIDIVCCSIVFSKYLNYKMNLVGIIWWRFVWFRIK